MGQANSTGSSHSSNTELTTRSTTNTQTFLETCVIDADHKALEEHLVSNPVQQSDLDRCLLRGLLIVQRKESELSHVAPALRTLLQSGAKWNSDVLLDDQKTPYHIICESPGDHHELLDLMIKSSPQTIIDSQDSRSSSGLHMITRCTAVVYAVINANINCLKCLIASKADVNIEFDQGPLGIVSVKSSAIRAAILNVEMDNKNRSVHEDIFDLLLDKSPIDSYTPLIISATNCRSVYCIKKLVEKGACLNVIDDNKCYVWSGIAEVGNVELLKCMFNRGIDKDSTDRFGVSVLWYVVSSGNIEAVRYLLDLGVVIPTCIPDVIERQCEQCQENMLIVEDLLIKDPCMLAICGNNLEIVKLLDEHGSQSCKSFTALRCAISLRKVDVILYLLNNYQYPLNIEYTKQSDQSRSMHTLLTEPRLILGSGAKIIKLLLDHGADPAKQMCSATSVNAIMSALVDGKLDIIAQYVRSGVDVNFRSYDPIYKNLLPFEMSVLRGYHNVAEMLLISGCSRGVFSLDNNHEFKNNVDPEVVKLMKEWKVEENNVISLQQRCRSVILNHLSPRADKKIKKLPLPGMLIKFLRISEIDDIVDAYKEAHSY